MAARPQTDCALTALGYALLGLIHQQPRSGYGLRKVFATTPMGHYSGSPGAIYPCLGRLEKQGLIEGQVDRKKSLRPRKIFRLTHQGLEVLRQWLHQLPTRDDVVHRLDLLLLRFAFMTGLVDSAATIRFLEALKTEGRAYLDYLRRVEDEIAQAPLHGRLALQHGIQVFEAHRKWVERALRQFKEEKL